MALREPARSGICGTGSAERIGCATNYCLVYLLYKDLFPAHLPRQCKKKAAGKGHPLSGCGFTGI